MDVNKLLISDIMTVRQSVVHIAVKLLSLYSATGPETSSAFVTNVYGCKAT